MWKAPSRRRRIPCDAVAVEQPDAMVNHFWWRPGWAPGRGYLTWHVLPNPEVIAYANAILERLAGFDQLAAVPARRLHVTGPGVGFADTFPPEQISAMVDRARVRLAALPAFSCSIGKAVAGAGGVHLPTTTDAFADLRGTLREAMRTVGIDPPGADDEAYAPHVTVAYATGPASRREVASRLSAAADVPRPTLRVRAAHLLELRMVPPGYDWTERANVALEQPAVEATNMAPEARWPAT